MGLMTQAQLPAGAGTVNTASFGTTKDGAAVHIFTLTNNHGLRAQVLDYGGIVCAVEAPGRDGKLANVILCQKDLAGIEATGPLSALTGRYANRIGHGFTIEGKHYDLRQIPMASPCMAGAPAYSRRMLETVRTFQHAGDAGVTLRLVSPDGDQGFPGTVTLDLTYTLTDSNDFKMEYKATTDKTDGDEPDQPHLLQSGGQWFGQCREPGHDHHGRPGDADRRISGADRRIHQCGGHAVRFPHAHADRRDHPLRRSADADRARL